MKMDRERSFSRFCVQKRSSRTSTNAKVLKLLNELNICGHNLTKNIEYNLKNIKLL